MPIFRSLDLERMLIYQKSFFYGKVLFFTQLSYHLMCKPLKKSYMLSSAEEIHDFGGLCKYGHVHQAKGGTGASPGTNPTFETNKQTCLIQNVVFKREYQAQKGSDVNPGSLTIF